MTLFDTKFFYPYLSFSAAKPAYSKKNAVFPYENAMYFFAFFVTAPFCMNTQAESPLTARASIGSKKRGYRKEITGCSALFVHARRLSIPAFASASKRKSQANIGKKSKDGSDERISSLPHRGALAKTKKTVISIVVLNFAFPRSCGQ